MSCRAVSVPSTLGVAHSVRVQEWPALILQYSEHSNIANVYASGKMVRAAAELTSILHPARRPCI